MYSARLASAGESSHVMPSVTRLCGHVTRRLVACNGAGGPDTIGGGGIIVPMATAVAVLARCTAFDGPAAVEALSSMFGSTGPAADAAAGACEAFCCRRTRSAGGGTTGSRSNHARRRAA